MLAPVQAALLSLSPRLAGWHGCWYWRFVAWLIGLRIRCSGEAASGGVLIAANHCSWLDVVVLGSLAPASFVAKREVGSWPLFGTIARLGRTIYVDRASRRGVAGPLAGIRARLAAGENVVLFPEGTSSDGNRVLSFRPAFFAAASAREGERPTPVQPVSVSYVALRGLPLDRRRRPQIAWYGEMPLWPHLRQALALGPVDARVVLHPPATLAGVGDRKALARYCETAVRSGLARTVVNSAPAV